MGCPDKVGASGIEPKCTPRGIRPAPRRGIEPLSPHGQWGCDASRITRRNRRRVEGRAEQTNGVTYGNRTRLRGFTFHPRPRRVTSPSMAQACAGGLPWSRTTFFRSSGGRYYSTSSQPLSALGGTCTRHRALERRASWLLDDEGPEPSPGIEPDPPAYGAGARPSSRKGTQAPAEGIEPPSS